MPWFIGSDQLLEVAGLKDPVTGAYVNTATVRATMYEPDGVTVVQGQTWPLTLSYVAASDGDYNGILEDGRDLKDGRLYWIELTADAGGDLIKKWRWSDTARYRVPADDAA
jgi:hypothetical protein